MSPTVPETRARESGGRWTFLTNHGHVLLCLYRNPDLRQRDIAALVGITEGAVQRILADLEECGFVEVSRIGRRNHYRVDAELHLRHPLEAGHTVGEVLRQLAPTQDLEARRPSTEPARSDRDRAA